MKLLENLKYSLFYEDEQTRKIRDTLKVVFFVYLSILIKLVVFKYPTEQLKEISQFWSSRVVLEGLDSANFTLFRTIKMYIRYWGRLNSFENLFGNIFLFSPLGFFLPFLHKKSRDWWALLGYSFLLVCGIEIFQLITAFGAFDVDDILLNCIGSLIGYLGFYAVWRSGKRRM